MASATMPRDLKRILDETVNVEGFVKCVTSQLHHIIGHITQRFMRMNHSHKPGMFHSHCGEQGLRLSMAIST